ncbi:MAG: pyrroline-5-carboxylate reductase [Desulfobacterales bacterium]
MQFEELTIGFIGAGNMAEAIAGALIESGTCPSSNITMADVDPGRLKSLAEVYGTRTAADNLQAFSASDLVVLAVKPQKVAAVLSELTAQPGYGVKGRKRFVSICAGTRIEKLEAMLYAPLSAEQQKTLPIIRVMPNTPALVLTGMSAMSPNRHADGNDLQITRKLLESMGKVIEVAEAAMDGVTALSGSGPAYLFYLAEAMGKAGESLGFAPEQAALLALQTLKGAVALMEKTGDSPEALREKVTSPAGTTQAAVDVLDAGRVMETVIEAIRAAARRSEELSR